MSKKITVQCENGVYPILLNHKFGPLVKALSEISSRDRKLCIVTDSHVEKEYAEEVRSLLASAFDTVLVFVFEAGEPQKNLSTVGNLYEFLIRSKFQRKDLLIALGGGVVGDLTGFAAATYLRGIDFIQVPTSLLAMVDSSIGGKTGVDYLQYKNMVGAFYQPKLVYINISTLQTLPENQYYAAMGEILKHGLIRDGAYYEWLIEHLTDIYARDSRILEETVLQSIRIKQAVVEEDPKEKGLRAILNFGHTVGHAVETLKQFRMLHGECVALGMQAAAYISWKRGYIEKEEFFEIRDMFVGFHLPISLDGLSTDSILEVMKNDKKAVGGTIQFILLKGIGNAVIDKTVTEEEMKESIEYIKLTWLEE
jgi:3-dehydroquinate synthase